MNSDPDLACGPVARHLCGPNLSAEWEGRIKSPVLTLKLQESGGSCGGTDICYLIASRNFPGWWKMDISLLESNSIAQAHHHRKSKGFASQGNLYSRYLPKWKWPDQLLSCCRQ